MSPIDDAPTQFKSIMSGNSRTDSPSKVCCFCNISEDDEVEYGKFYEYNGIVTHYYCLLLSSNMEQRGNDDEGILGFLTEDIQKELRRGKRLACSYCKKIGATLGCCNVKCKRIFHFPCGLKAGSLHQYFGEFRSYCINHRIKQKIDERILAQISSLDNILCYICYEGVDPSDFVKTLWAPCCKKNAFFHRRCVQQLALSAGYFFKCPLCNNKEDFRNAMLENGIFIPSQDASWELVPNAFEELLYRHNQCDAVKCLCPKGRKHISSNAKWELTLCRICGSQGIHMACGQLKWANPIWECTECTSILHKSKNNQNAESDSSSDDLNRDCDSDSSTDTDISVGMDFPMSCPSPSFSSSSSSISLPDSTSDVALRPGPRSFKLQQRMIKWLELTNEFIQKNISNKVNQVTITSPKKDDNEKSLANKENNTRKERQVSKNSNDITSQPIQEADVITIESDDDNEIEIITLKQKTDSSLQLPSQSSIPHISSLKDITKPQLNTTVENSTSTSLNATSSKDIVKPQLNTAKNPISKSLNATSTNLLKKDNIQLHKFVASEPKISNKNEITSISKHDTATSRKFMPDLVSNSNDFSSLNTENIRKSPTMNIKITNVTSLPPEVFENVPNGILQNSIDTSSPSTSKSLDELVTYVAPSKRMYEEVNHIDTKFKKVKKDLDEKSSEKNKILFCNVLACNESQQQNGQIIPLNKICENEDSLKCTPVNELSDSYNNSQENNLSIQLMPFPKTDDEKRTSQVAENYLEEDSLASLYVQRTNENSVKARRTYLPSSKCKNQVCLPLNNSCFASIKPITNRDAENNRNTLLIPPSINMAHTSMTNDYTIYNFESRPVQNIVVNKLMPLNIGVPVITNSNQTNMLDEKKTALMREKVLDNVSNSDSSSSKNIFCDGDAGCCPAEIDSTGRKKTDPSNESNGSMDTSNAVQSPHSVGNRSVFPQVTNNHSTCHQPRLIPKYMNLKDLKFRVCKPDHVQMALYDTFSVNISIKNPKESKIRSASVAQGKPEELSYYILGEASSSEGYNDIQTSEQQFKTFCSSNLINDKNKYVVHDQDDAKENLDPDRSKINTLNNGLMNNVGDTVTVHDSFCGEADNEMRLIASDTNLSALNRTICNKNIEQHKQVSVCDITPAEEKIARSFCKETSRTVHNVDFDFNIVKTNKNIEKILQDDITVSINRHNRDSNNKTDNDHTDDSQTILQSNKHLDSTNIKRPNSSANRVSNIMFNEHSILNKQIDASDSVKFIQCLELDKNTVNSENSFRHNNSGGCLKVSIDLCKIQNLIDSKPELFVNWKSNNNKQRDKSTS